MPNKDVESVWENVVGRYFEAAKTAIGAPDKDQTLDGKAFNVWKNVDPWHKRVEDLGKWVGQYKIARSGLKKQNKLKPSRAFAATAIRYFDALEASAEIPDHPDLAWISERFYELRRRLANTYGEAEANETRSHLSLPAKLLWTRFPDDAPIYDGQAKIAIRFFVKLLKAMSGLDPFDDAIEKRHYNDLTLDEHRPPKHTNFDDTKVAHNDGWYYRDFCDSHRVIFEQFRPAIKKRIPEGDKPPVTAFRIFDKILWIVGNESQDYSLKGSGIGPSGPL